MTIQFSESGVRGGPVVPGGGYDEGKDTERGSEGGHRTVCLSHLTVAAQLLPFPILLILSFSASRSHLPPSLPPAPPPSLPPSPSDSSYISAGGLCPQLTAENTCSMPWNHTHTHAHAFTHDNHTRAYAHAHRHLPFCNRAHMYTHTHAFAYTHTHTPVQS